MERSIFLLLLLTSTCQAFLMGYPINSRYINHFLRNSIDYDDPDSWKIQPRYLFLQSGVYLPRSRFYKWHFWDSFIIFKEIKLVKALNISKLFLFQEKNWNCVEKLVKTQKTPNFWVLTWREKNEIEKKLVKTLKVNKLLIDWKIEIEGKNSSKRCK